MSQTDRTAAAARRKARLIEHIKQGKTVTEICDIEGLDHANEPQRMRREVAKPEGLTISTGRSNALPVGLEQIDRIFRGWLKIKLEQLRDHHHHIDVAHMVGLTNVEQRRAIKNEHNWTIAQIQRLAVASGLTFRELLAYASQPAVGSSLLSRKEIS